MVCISFHEAFMNIKFDLISDTNLLRSAKRENQKLKKWFDDELEYVQ
jgi:hypothetical protein